MPPPDHKEQFCNNPHFTLLIPAHHKSATPQVMLEIIVCSRAPLSHRCHTAVAVCRPCPAEVGYSSTSSSDASWVLGSSLMLHTGTVQVYSVVSKTLYMESALAWTRCSLQMKDGIVTATSLKAAWKCSRWSQGLSSGACGTLTHPLPLSNIHLFFPWAGFAVTDGCLCEWISTACLIFWLQPCLTPVFLSQVLHSNFEDCGLLKPVVKTVLGWLSWSSHLPLTDLT